MQPDFHDFGSGLRYRTTVKPSFRSVMRFYLLVSIYENTSFWRFLSFLTAGNKSYCGTLQHLTHPQQSTDSPIPEPVSSSKRQALQRKPFALSPVPTQTSSRLRKHRTSVPSRPQKLPGALIRTTSAPPMRPSHTPDAPQPHPRCVPSHAPRHTPDAPLPPQIRMQFPNRSDSVIQSDTNKQDAQGELHAKLPDTPPPPIKVARNSSGTSFINSSKTAEYQRSDFKT